jgi:hypothetical protein
MEAQALAGFGWGFDVHDQQISLVPPFAVGPTEWVQNMASLAAAFPDWRFQPGFRAA